MILLCGGGRCRGSYGFRVYSQQQLASERSRIWSSLHERVVSAILSSEIDISIDSIGRLIVADASSTSHPSDVDGDGFYETIVVSPLDAAQIAKGDPARVYETIVKRVGDWRLLPRKIEQKTLIEELKPGNSSPHDGRIEVAGQGSLPEATMPPSKSDKTESASADVEVKGTEEKVESTLASPHKATGIMLHLGETVDAFERAQEYLNISNTELNQLNIGVVGDLGTGKTQLLKSIIYQMSQGKEQNEGISPNVLIFDYKKDYSAEEFVSVVKARVIPPYNLPLNLFDISNAGDDPNAWLRRYQFFSDVLDKIFSGIGPVQRQLLKQAVRAAYADQQQIGAQPTIYDVHAQYKILVGQRVDSVFSILDDLVDMQIFAREPEPGSFGRFFDGVVVIELNALGQDDRTKNMLVAVMLNMFYEHMLKIPKRPYRGKSPQLRIVDSFLLVDEADNIMRYEFDVLRKILLQGREFGVGVILASQYLRHFKAGATDYREPLLTWFLHKVPNVTPQELGALGLTADVAALAERIKTLPNHNCLFKTVGASGQVIDGLPFYKLKGIDRSA